MVNKMTTDQLKKSIKIFANEIGNKYFFLDKAWFFGSRHKKINKPDSDYDIAIQIIWDGDELNNTLQEIIYPGFCVNIRN